MTCLFVEKPALTVVEGCALTRLVFVLLCWTNTVTLQVYCLIKSCFFFKGMHVNNNQLHGVFLIFRT